jgi:hypothetical protein
MLTDPTRLPTLLLSTSRVAHTLNTVLNCDREVERRRDRSIKTAVQCLLT